MSEHCDAIACPESFYPVVRLMVQDPPSNWAIHHDMLTARFGPGEPDAALWATMAAFVPSLPHYKGALDTQLVNWL